MRTLLVAFVFVLTWAAQAAGTQITVQIDGMTCPSCAASVERELKKLPQVAVIDISLRKGTATITLREGQSLSQERIGEAVKAAGYKVRLQPDLQPMKEPVSRELESAFDHVMSKACEKSCATQQPYDESQIKKQDEARIGDLVRCPVSGVIFELRKDSAVVTYGGKTYHTCCATCAEKFRRNPERFAKNLS